MGVMSLWECSFYTEPGVKSRVGERGSSGVGFVKPFSLLGSMKCALEG